MSQADIIQVDYETLVDIAARFGRAARGHEEDVRRINAAQWALMDSWQGQAATSFFWELTGDVMPSFRRLISALDEAERITLEIGRTFREAEEEAAGLFSSGGPVCLPGAAWTAPSDFEQPTPDFFELMRAIVEAFENLQKKPELIAKFIERLLRPFRLDPRQIIEPFGRWVEMWSIDPYSAFKYGVTGGRILPRIGDTLTVVGGLIDIGETWHQNWDEYSDSTPSRAAAALGVDAVIAAIPAVTELAGGIIGAYTVGAFATRVGAGIGGGVGLRIGGPKGAVGGAIAGGLLFGATGAVAGDVTGGELGRRIGEGVRDWVRSSGTRERAIETSDFLLRTIILPYGQSRPNISTDTMQSRRLALAGYSLGFGSTYEVVGLGR